MVVFQRGFITVLALLSGAGLADAEDSWVARGSGLKGNLYEVVWTGNLLVVAGDSGAFTSANGNDWTLRHAGPRGNLLWTGSRLVSSYYTSWARPQAQGWDYTNYQVTSPDGTNWALTGGAGGEIVSSYLVCGGLFLSLGVSLDGSWVQISQSQIRTSSDGLAWE